MYVCNSASINVKSDVYSASNMSSLNFHLQFGIWDCLLGQHKKLDPDQGKVWLLLERLYTIPQIHKTLYIK
jgi:hypothetical protein